jgi:predicted secreted protein
VSSFSLNRLIPTIFLLCSAAANAEDTPLTYDRIDLSASAEGEVANDILVAVLSRESEGPSAAPLADEVNKTVDQAIKRIKQIPDIAVQTLDYQTLPSYQKNRITGWRVRQSIRLEARDAGKLSNLLGELQQQLNVDSIGYSVSPDRMKEAENHLISAALKGFQQRAELITQELGRTRYRIVAMRVEAGGPPRPIYRAGRNMAMEAAAPPTIEAGEQKVQIVVNGTIELQTN